MEKLLWLVNTGTNEVALKFLDNNSFLLIAGWGLVMMVLKYRAKQTPTTSDDEAIAEVDSIVKGWFSRSVKNQAMNGLK